MEPVPEFEPGPVVVTEPVIESITTTVIEIIPLRVEEPVIESVAEPVTEPVAKILLEPAVETPGAPIAESMPKPESALEIPDTAPPVSLPSQPSPPPVFESAMNTPIKLPANNSFTLWTLPAVVAAAPKQPVPAAPVRSSLRLSGQPFTLWTQPGRVDRIVMRNGAAPAAGQATAARRDTVSSRQQWLSLAAGFAIAAVFGMGYLFMRSERQSVREELAQEKSKAAAEISTIQVQAKEAFIKAEDARSRLTAKEADFTAGIAMLKTALTKAGEAAKKAEAAVIDTTAALDKTKQELAGVKKDYSAKETTLQNNLTALTEENGKVKRLAGEEASKARETIARLEEEKAAAVKASTAAMADRDAMKAEVEKLRKQLQSPSKPSGTPEA